MELKEKLRGSSLGTSRPQSGQAMEEENSCSSAFGRAAGDQHQAVGQLQGFGDGRFEALFDGWFAVGSVRGPTLVAESRQGWGTRCGWHRSGACRPDSRLEQDAVDDGFDGVVLAACRGAAARRGRRISPSTRARKPCWSSWSSRSLNSPLRPRTMGAMTVTRSPVPSCEDALDDLVGGLAGDGPAAVGAVRRADRGVEQAQVVVDLGDGADGGARAAAGGLLLDGDGGAEAFDGVHVGPLDLVEKLARVGREGFDIAALALGVDGVEGERAFAGAGETGDHRERVAGNAHVDVAQIVLARPAHRDVSDGHGEAERSKCNG